MAAKTSLHRYGTKLRHCHPMYNGGLRRDGGVKGRGSASTPCEVPSNFSAVVAPMNEGMHITHTQCTFYKLYLQTTILSFAQLRNSF